MKFLIFIGTLRDSQPPSPKRLGIRVSKYFEKIIQQEFKDCETEVIDPMDYNFGKVFKPHFSYAAKDLPRELEDLAEKIRKADGFIMVSPEYNHSMSPALSHMLNHFGSSLFSYKPSLIATYSAGQWGGARAATQMRVFLSELGCLPVSAMIHVPSAHKAFSEDGSVLESKNQSHCESYFSRGIAQLEWWAQATMNYKKEVNLFTRSKAFKKDPSQRNVNGQ